MCGVYATSFPQVISYFRHVTVPVFLCGTTASAYPHFSMIYIKATGIIFGLKRLNNRLWKLQQQCYTEVRLHTMMCRWQMGVNVLPNSQAIKGIPCSVRHRRSS